MDAVGENGRRRRALERCGMRTDLSVLVVLDGSKALLSAVRAVFGPRAVVQRCQVHKRRNVEDHLPENMRCSIGSVMSKAYRSRDTDFPQDAPRGGRRSAKQTRACAFHHHFLE